MISGLVWKPWYFVPKDFSRSNQDSKVCQFRWWLYCKNILDIISIFCESSSLHRLQTFGERLTLYIAYTDVSSYPCCFTLYTATVHLLHICICTVHSIQRWFISSLIDLFEQESEYAIDVIEDCREDMRETADRYKDETDELRATSRMLRKSPA